MQRLRGDVYSSISNAVKDVDHEAPHDNIPTIDNMVHITNVNSVYNGIHYVFLVHVWRHVGVHDVCPCQYVCEQ